MKIFGFIFLLGCLLFAVVGFIIVFRDIMHLAQSVIVPGSVVRYDSHETRDSKTHETSTFYAAVISFSVNGKTLETTSTISSSVASDGNIGQTRKIVFNPKNNEARLLKDIIWEMLFFSVMFFIAAACLAVGLIILFQPILTKLMSSMSSEQGLNAAENFIHSHPVISAKILIAITKAFKLIVMLLALAPGMFGARLLYSRLTFFRDAVIVPGTVVRYTTRQEYDQDSHDTTTMYTKIISYSFNGETREIRSHMSSSVRPEIGQKYKVGINPKNPYEARIYSRWDYGVAVGLMCLSGILLLFVLKLLF